MTKVSGKTYSAFTLALQLKGYLPPTRPDLDLRSMKHCLRDLQRKNIFVALHYEHFKPEVAYLGNIVNVNENKVELRCVTPTGETEKETTGFVIAGCTRVDFFGEYERAIQLSALYLIAGKTARNRKKIIRKPVRRVKRANPSSKSARGRPGVSSRSKP